MQREQKLMKLVKMVYLYSLVPLLQSIKAFCTVVLAKLVDLKWIQWVYYESGYASGIVSLQKLCTENYNFQPQYVEELSFDKLAHLIIRGGWPDGIDDPLKDSHLVAKQYVNAILSQELVDESGNKFDYGKIKLISK